MRVRSLVTITLAPLAFSGWCLLAACGSDASSASSTVSEDGATGTLPNDPSTHDASAGDSSTLDATSADGGSDAAPADSAAPDASSSACKTSACAVQLTVQNTHVCALRGDGTVVCWGNNDHGQLGDGTTTTRNVPVAVVGLGPVTRLANNAGAFTCALMQDTTVKCWGANDSGQLGDGTATDHHAPTSVSGLSGVEALYSGDYGSCARLGGGQVKCWGYNAYGQLGTNVSLEPRLSPVDVPAFFGAIEIDPAGLSTCALFADGTVRCVGYNGTGALGDGTEVDRTAPVVVSGLTDAKAIVMGWYHACALRAGGVVSCWGFNGNGQLNDGTTTDHFTPQQVPGLTDVIAIASGAYDVCVRHPGGSAMCWAQGVETTVAIGEPLEQVLPGNRSTCARTSTGKIYCWGANEYGTLGDGTFTYRATPGPVPGFP